MFCALRLSSEDYPYALTAGAAAVGLTIATKGTGFVVLPAVLAACFLARYRIRKEWLLRDGLVFATIVVILNAPPSLRNYNLTGNPLGTNFAGGGAHLDASVGRISVRDSAANLLRNLALQFTLTEKATDEVEQYTVKAIRWLGADPDDPDFIWRRIDNANGYGFEVQSFNRNETYAGNPLQILMLLGALVLCAIVPISRRRDVVLYALGIVISALLFSALLRWQRWGARLELPILILGVPLLAVVLEATLRPTVIVGIVAMLVVTSVPCVVANEYRPLLFSSLSPRELRTRPFAGNLFTKSRDAFYFEDHHRDLFHSYVDASRFVQSTGCKDVGIDTTFEHYEYPAMAFLGFAEGNVHLRYTGIRNLTAKYIDPAEKPPCAVICFACSRSRAKAEAYTTTGTKTAIFGNAVVFYGNIRDTKAPTGTAIAAGDPKVDQDGIAASWQKLSDFRQYELPRYSALYMEGLQRGKESRSQIETWHDAFDRPYYDGRRIRELIEQLRTTPGHDPRILDEALAEGSEALRGFVLLESQYADAFVQNVGGDHPPADRRISLH